MLPPLKAPPPRRDTTPTLSPVALHDVDKKTLAGIKAIVEKVIFCASIEARGRDLMIQVYLAGMYHGAAAQSGWRL